MFLLVFVDKMYLKQSFHIFILCIKIYFSQIVCSLNPVITHSLRGGDDNVKQVLYRTYSLSDKFIVGDTLWQVSGNSTNKEML